MPIFDRTDDVGLDPDPDLSPDPTPEERRRRIRFLVTGILILAVVIGLCVAALVMALSWITSSAARECGEAACNRQQTNSFGR